MNEKERESRNAQVLVTCDNFLMDRLLQRKPPGMRQALVRQYQDLLIRDRTTLIQNLMWCYDGKSLAFVTGTDGSIPFRKEEVDRLGGVSKQAIAYFIVKKQFETYDFLNSGC